MGKNFDLICIGLGPAGMAVSIMGAEMGLRVCAIEKNKIGGECMSVGCIPSKSLLNIALLKDAVKKLKEMGLTDSQDTNVFPPFGKINGYTTYINEQKTGKMFEKVHLVLGKGSARFIDPYTVAVGSEQFRAKRIFIATGTEPMIPPIPGIDSVSVLTNKNIFLLEKAPASLVIIGGGAIGCEMAQAFSRLGTTCSIIQIDEHLLPGEGGDPEAGKLLESVFKEEGIAVHNAQKISRIEQKGALISLHTESGLSLQAEKLLVAAGRHISFDGLDLDKAGIHSGPRGIPVDTACRTDQKHIYAVGDCNGKMLLSHAAMHQGMFALMNAVSPFSFFKKRHYVIPWTVFTDPAVSFVGMSEKTLKEKNIRYETHVVRYEDYGAAIAEHAARGYVKIFCTVWGKVLGASIVGKGSGEMINEWALIVQKKIRLYDIVFLAHSFPTMGFLTKRVAETWMMKRMQNPFLKAICAFFFRYV